MGQPEVVKKLVSLPPDVKQWLEREARRNLSSANSEIVRALRDRMEQREKAVG
jgi:hypothetical protein